jgi:arylsulfatase A-like enzyme
MFDSDPPAKAAATADVTRPRLVVEIVVDQLSYDSLIAMQEKFGSEGFSRFIREGARFEKARYQHANTETCPGHAAIATGTWGVANGVIANKWHRALSGVEIDCAGNSRRQLEKRLLQPGVGDLLEEASDGAGKVIAVSGKRAAAALLAGPAADSAWWPDGQGRFVTWDDAGVAPGWIDSFNATRAAGGKGLAQPGSCPKVELDDARAADDAVTEFAVTALAEEGMGRDEIPDLLAISYSGSDLAGHRYGVESPEWEEALLCIDRQLARLLGYLDREYGRNGALIVLTADHGVAPSPEFARKTTRGRMAGRISEEAITAAVNQALTSAFGKPHIGDWVAFHDFPNIYLNEALAVAKGVDVGDAARLARHTVAQQPGILGAYAHDELLVWQDTGKGPSIAQPVLLGFHPERSGDVIYQVQRYQVVANSGSNHGSHWGYDAHVPLMWLGPGIRAGSYGSPASPVDIAPTLLTLLGIRSQPAMNGCVLGEALTGGAPPCDRRRLLQPLTQSPG